MANRLECLRGSLHCSDKCRSVFLENASPEEVCVLNHRFARDVEQLFQRGAYKFEAERAAAGVRPGLVRRSGQAIRHVAQFALGVMACAGLHDESQIAGDENGQANEHRREETNLSTLVTLTLHGTAHLKQPHLLLLHVVREVIYRFGRRTPDSGS